MAIPDIIKGFITNSVNAYIEHGETDIRTIVMKIGSKYDLDPTKDWLTAWNLVKKIIDNQAGQHSLVEGGLTTDNQSDLPTDYSLINTSGSYGYKVKVTITNTDTGDSWGTVIIISSNTPLTSDEIIEQATELAQDIGRTGTTTNPGDKGYARFSVKVEILSAGMRP